APPVRGRARGGRSARRDQGLGAGPHAHGREPGRARLRPPHGRRGPRLARREGMAPDGDRSRPCSRRQAGDGQGRLPRRRRHEGGRPQGHAGDRRARAGMTAARVEPYGTWSSPITPAMLASASRRLGFTWLAEGTVYFTESRPDEGGRTVLMRAD